MVDKYKLQTQDKQSMNLNATTLDKLRQLLPEVFSENITGKPHIDVEKLKLALGHEIDIDEDNQTRYSFVWSGKKQAQLEANKPSTATLRPCIEDSKNWDGTKNVYIEGDNLEVLKLLQKSYYGKIKMIYIDPPYNTGKDFVYKDNYHDNVTNYLQLTGQVDDNGNRINTNTDTNGRYHTDWLNMMYPRLKLARNLLRDDGVIFISIDDNEVHNLRKICDEIFGEENFVAQVIVKSNPGGRDYGGIAVTHEYMLSYAKEYMTELNLVLDKTKVFDFKDFIGEFDVRELRNRNIRFNINNRPNLCYPFYVDITEKDNNGLYSVSLENKTGFIEVLPLVSQGVQTVWRWGKEKSKSELNINVMAKLKQDNTFMIVEKYRSPFKRERSIFDESNIRNESGSLVIKKLFNNKPFDYPKSVDLIKRVCLLGANPNDIIIDFFSGSATTAHAVMQLNAEDGGNRKYICVQLPEATQPDDEAYKAGYKNICQIGKERIRRAGDIILAEWQAKQQPNDMLSDDNENTAIMPDIGFKVFKLDTSNIKPFNNDNLFDLNLFVESRTSSDLFYELVIKQGYTLEHKQSVIDILGTKCYALLNIDNVPFVLAVLDDMVRDNFATAILKYPLNLVVVKDSCFSSDEIKLNILATLEQLQTSGNKLPHGNELQIRII